MINDDSLKKLYDSVINNEALVTKTLNGYGFNSKNIKKLIDMGIIERFKKGHYTFIGLNDLFNYGKRINKLGEYDKSILCFDKCFELSINNEKLYLPLFISYIVNMEYEKSLKCLDQLIKLGSENERKNDIFYLYLLSNIIKLPKKYERLLGDYNQLKNNILYKAYDENHYLQNDVRLSAINKKFSLALNKQKKLDDTYGYNTLSFIINRLLNGIISEQLKQKQQILQLIDNKKYEQIVELINERKTYNNRSVGEYYIVYLAESIIEIKNTGIIPEPEVNETDDLYIAIDGQNYELAQKLDERHREECYNRNIIMTRLLQDINQLINSIKQEQKDDDIDTKVNICDKEKLNLIFYWLSINNREKAFKFLHEYLESKDNIKYELFIRSLIEISIFKGDKFFSFPIQVLLSINNNDYYFEGIDYTKYFFDSLNKNSLEEAKLYLDVIKSLSNNQNKILELEKLLNCSLENVEEIKGPYTKRP